MSCRRARAPQSRGRVIYHGARGPAGQLQGRVARSTGDGCKCNCHTEAAADARALGQRSYLALARYSSTSSAMLSHDEWMSYIISQLS